MSDLMNTLKDRIKTAMLAKNDLEKNLLRSVLGEAQTVEARSGTITDEEVEAVVRKSIKGNYTALALIVLGKEGEDNKELLNATIQKFASNDAALVAQVKAKNQSEYDRVVKENAVLESLVPKQLTAQDIEAFFLNSDNPEFEQIQNAKADGQATGIAMKALKAAGLVVDGRLVGEVVKKIRSQA